MATAVKQVKQLKCDRCETNEEAKIYDPRTAGHPHKTVNLCNKCAAADRKAVPIDNKVPEIEPALPGKLETAPPQAPLKSIPPAEGPRLENINPRPADKPASTEPIDRQVIRDKLTVCEKELNSAQESKRRVLAQAEQVKSQLNQVQNIINIKSVQIASYRDVLGNEG